MPSKSEEPESTQSGQADGPAARIEQQAHGAPVLPLPPALVLNAIVQYWPDIDLDETVATALPPMPFTAGAIAAEANADQNCSSSSGSVSMSIEELSCVASGADTAAESRSALLNGTAGGDDASACPSFPSSDGATSHSDPNSSRPRLIKKRNRTGIMDKITQVQGIKPWMQIPGESIQAVDKNGVVVKSFANSIEFRRETHLRFDKINRVLEGKQATAHGMRWRYYRGSDEDRDVPPLPNSKRVRRRRNAVPRPVLGIAEEESEQEPEERNLTAPFPVPSLLETEVGAEKEDLLEMTEGEIVSEAEPNGERIGEEGGKIEKKRERESYEENGVHDREDGTERESVLMSLVTTGETSHLSDGISNNSNSLDDYSHTLDNPDGVSVDSIAYGRAPRVITDIGFSDSDHDCMVQEDLEDLGFSDVHFAGYVT
jgi:hypothetical protein